MKNVFILIVLIYSFNLSAQVNRADDDFLERINNEGMTYYQFKKNNLKEKFLPTKYMPKKKTIIYDGKNVQLLLMGLTMISHAPMPGSNVLTERKSEIAMLFAKKINEDYFTYIGYYPEKKDQISIHPFKKFASLFINDFPELAEKVSKKKKGYTRYDAIDVFKEYDNWLNSNKK